MVAALTLAATAASCTKDDEVTDPGQSLPGPYRPATTSSRAEARSVVEWTPAPGQFINEAPGLTTAEEAAAWATDRLSRGESVSLGGFGGYVVVDFDHSIKAGGTASGYDLAVAGNAFLNASSASGGSNEPGIVWVMQDANGNGLADDGWLELRGSAWDTPDHTRGYAVTYTRPDAPGSDVPWTDNAGGSGAISHMGSLHPQPYYYPAWVEADSYTLTGSRLSARTGQGADGVWNNSAYDWGYADNLGSDNRPTGNYRQCNRFRIADAVTADGLPANLPYIDFVKIQTAVNARSGILGEVSTEVLGVMDLHLCE